MLKENQEVTDGNLPTLDTGLRGIITVFHTTVVTYYGFGKITLAFPLTVCAVVADVVVSWTCAQGVCCHEVFCSCCWHPGVLLLLVLGVVATRAFFFFAGGVWWFFLCCSRVDVHTRGVMTLLVLLPRSTRRVRASTSRFACACACG